MIWREKTNKKKALFWFDWFDWFDGGSKTLKFLSLNMIQTVAYTKDFNLKKCVDPKCLKIYCPTWFCHQTAISNLEEKLQPFTLNKVVNITFLYRIRPRLFFSDAVNNAKLTDSWQVASSFESERKKIKSEFREKSFFGEKIFGQKWNFKKSSSEFNYLQKLSRERDLNFNFYGNWFVPFLTRFLLWFYLWTAF